MSVERSNSNIETDPRTIFENSRRKPKERVDLNLTFDEFFELSRVKAELEAGNMTMSIEAQRDYILSLRNSSENNRLP